MNRFLGCIFLAASVVCAATAACAQDGVTHPFAPWMKLISSEDETMRMMSQGSPAVRIANTNSYPARAGTPEAPVITPQVTTDLINKIYGKQKIEPPSELEQIYARRIAGIVNQFGYDQFGPQPEDGKTNEKP